MVISFNFCAVCVGVRFQISALGGGVLPLLVKKNPSSSLEYGLEEKIPIAFLTKNFRCRGWYIFEFRLWGGGIEK